MNKRILNIVVIFLCLVLFIFPVIFSYESAYAYTLPSENPFGLSAEEARKIVNEHDVIYGSNKEPYFVYMNDVKAWKCITDISAFDTQLTDDQVVDILSSVNTFQYAVTAGQFLNVSSQIFKGLGYLTGGVTDAFLNLLKSNGGELTKGMTYDENNGITILSDTVDKLREEIKKQYYASIGLHEVKPVNSVKSVLSSSKFRNFYEHEEDFVSDSLAFKDYNYMFISDYNCIFFNNYDYAYLNREEWVYSALGQVNYYPIYFMNGKSDADRFPLEYRSVLHYSVLNNSNAYNFYSNMKNIYANDRYSYFNFYYLAYKDSSEVNYQTDRIGFDGFVDFYGTKPFKYFVSYSSYYNYLYGDQNAYLSSKVEEAGENIKISIDDMNINISDKMDSLIDSINNKKEGMSADELQSAIDKGLEEISGKMDDIKDNTQEMNSKLDSLLSVMQSQNDILMNILGVTTDIYKVVSSTNKEDGTNYTISDLQPHFNKCFTAVKNMVLYGIGSFDDVGAQSVMSVDNDVGEIMVADDVENHVKDYHNGLLGKFPFSVPYQLYEWLQVLQLI